METCETPKYIPELLSELGAAEPVRAGHRLRRLEVDQHARRRPEPRAAGLPKGHARGHLRSSQSKGGHRPK